MNVVRAVCMGTLPHASTRRWYAALGLLVLAMLSSFAFAQPKPQNASVAKREFAIALAAEQRRDWNAAIDHYLRSFEAHPHPDTAYNIAANYVRLGQARNAAHYYQRYLASKPSAPDRNQVEATIAALAKRPSAVHISANTPTTRFRIDDAPPTPGPVHVTLEAGRHTVLADTNGNTTTHVIDLAYGEPYELAVEVDNRPAILEVQSTREATQVEIDGTIAVIGTAPTAMTLAPGTHKLWVRVQGAEPTQQEVVLRPGERQRLALSPVLAARQAPPEIVRAWRVGLESRTGVSYVNDRAEFGWDISAGMWGRKYSLSATLNYYDFTQTAIQLGVRYLRGNRVGSGAAWFWGGGANLGTYGLVTDARLGGQWNFGKRHMMGLSLEAGVGIAFSVWRSEYLPTRPFVVLPLMAGWSIAF